MSVAKVFKFSARLILVPIVMLLQFGLTVCSVVFSVFGGIGELIGSIVGIDLIAGSLLCSVMGILEGPCSGSIQGNPGGHFAKGMLHAADNVADLLACRWLYISSE